MANQISNNVKIISQNKYIRKAIDQNSLKIDNLENKIDLLIEKK